MIRWADRRQRKEPRRGVGGQAVKIIRRLTVPTGDILIVQGDRGPLECLSLGDYGQAKNCKAAFLGLDRPIDGVPHGDLVPLSEKWVVTISTQYGCSMGCSFCDVPKVGPGKNATLPDMQGQVLAALSLHPEVTTAKRLNVHFARMGEPTWNPDVLECARWLKAHIDPEYRVHPVVSTMAPRHNDWLPTFLHTWMRIKNRLYHGEAGLQLSINSTDESERAEMFGGNALDLYTLHRIFDGVIPAGRKIALNFALAGYTIDPDLLARYFPPSYFMCKITPMHMTAACEANGIRTDGGYERFTPYAPTEAALRAVGYDVIVFVPSLEEDRGRITCGNAILSGTEPLPLGGET